MWGRDAAHALQGAVLLTLGISGDISLSCIYIYVYVYMYIYIYTVCIYIYMDSNSLANVRIITINPLQCKKKYKLSPKTGIRSPEELKFGVHYFRQVV
jgi:hypothetical protein